jgi:hypothetical protein
MTVVNTSNFVMPSSLDDRKKIMDCVQEVSNSMVRIEGEKAFIKDALADLCTKYEIPKALLNRFVKAYHNRTYDTVLGENSDFETMVEILVKPTVE